MDEVRAVLRETHLDPATLILEITEGALLQGIKLPEQLASLRASGCGSGQGFYFAKPVPAEALAGMLEEAAAPTMVTRQASRVS